MSLKTFNSGGRIYCQIPKNFGFDVRHEFRKVLTDNPSGTKYDLDFRQVEKMETSALGMLLLLREHAGGVSSDIVFRNTTSDIDNMLHLVNFHKLFKII